jgi:hypothetical protein
MRNLLQKNGSVKGVTKNETPKGLRVLLHFDFDYPSLVIDADGCLYLGESFTDGPADKAKLNVRDLKPVSLEDALWWYARNDPAAIGSQGFIAEVCERAADALAGSASTGSQGSISVRL